MTISEQRKRYNQEYSQRTHRVSLTFTATEYEELEKQAKAEGVKPTTLVKNRTIAYQKQAPIIPETLKEELKELRFLIRKWQIISIK
jgi:hypothetical protein